MDIADVFPAADQVPGIVESCMRIKCPAIWLQEGAVNETDALKAPEAGMMVVMDRCKYKEHLDLMTA